MVVKVAHALKARSVHNVTLPRGNACALLISLVKNVTNALLVIGITLKTVANVGVVLFFSL